MIQKKTILGAIFLVTVSLQSAQNVEMSKILQNYEQALQKLLIVQGQDPVHKTKNIFSDSLILSTYKKLIAPSVSWINGYARVVLSEIASKYSYDQDFYRLALEYEKHKKSIQKIINLFPKDSQDQALEIFHESLTEMVEQLCFNVVQQLTNQNILDDSSLTSAYQAYKLGWQIRTKNMKLSGAPSQKDFETLIVQNMTTLFSNVASLAQNSLASKISSGVSVQDVYKNLEQYYKVLHNVYIDSGDSAAAKSEQDLLVALKVSKQSYVQAQAEQKQATTLAQSARNLIVLDVKTAPAVLTSIDASIKNMTTAVGLYTTAEQSFQQAQNGIGVSVCQNLQTNINDGDLLLRVIQKLWGLYLNDQSTTAGFYTFPTLQQFVNGQAAGQSANAVQSLQNLVGMCDNSFGQTNNVGSLISATDSLLIVPILKNLILFIEEHSNISQKQDVFFDAKLLQKAQTVISVLTQWSNELIQAVGNTDQSAMAKAMGYAKLLDQLWDKDKKLDQLVPNLPDCLSSDATWVNFSAQFLYQAGLISSVAQANALVGAVKVTQPVVVTAQDLKTMQNQADQFFSKASAFEKDGNLAQAATTYEQAMMLYQKLYQYESTGMMQIKMLQLANLAKTRFAACSFGSTVKTNGSLTFGQILNIPKSYVAENYQLSFDPTLMGSTLPACLSSLQPGQSLTTLSAMDQKDVLTLIKGYLVAQKMMDQAMISNGGSPTFTDYFSDYTLSKVVQPSQRAQLAIAQISAYLNNFENIAVTSVTINSSSQVTIALKNWPLKILTPPCSTISVAGTYFTAAATLFAPGTTALSFGGQVYDPGNDVGSQSLMLQNLGYTYLSAAQDRNHQLAITMQSLSKSLGITAKGATAQTLPQGFGQTFSQIQNQAISIQALLYGSTSCAYQYFVQANALSIAQKIKEEFLNIYKQQINFAKNCLVGDPTSFDYRAIITAINQFYVSWSSELDPVKDVGLIAHINEQIAQLYEFAGKKCLNYTYELPSFPGIKQKHFMVAAQYFRSAQFQYKALQDSVKEKLLVIKLNEMYFQACLQNLNLYLHVKEQGALFHSLLEQKEVPISFVQLLQNFNDGSIGSGQSTLYATVQHLLFDAAMVLEYLSGSSSISAKSNKNHQTMLKFLSKNRLIDASSLTSFAAIPMNASEKIIKLISKNYAIFSTKPLEFAALNQLMVIMVKNMYMMDYQSITQSSSSTQISLATQQFLSSISNEASSLQNPSVGYVG